MNKKDRKLGASVQERLKDEIRLREWDECIGVLRKIEVRRSETIVVLTKENGLGLRIILPTASPEQTILAKKLGNELINEKVGLLRTDDCDRSILIRRING